MGDTVALRTKIEPADRRRREFRRVNFEGAHALGRARKLAKSIEAARWIDAGIAVRDISHFGHALETIVGASILTEKPSCHGKKWLMYIVGWNTSSDAVNIGGH